MNNIEIPTKKELISLRDNDKYGIIDELISGIKNNAEHGIFEYVLKIKNHAIVHNEYQMTTTNDNRHDWVIGHQDMLKNMFNERGYDLNVSAKASMEYKFATVTMFVRVSMKVEDK